MRKVYKRCLAVSRNIDFEEKIKIVRDEKCIEVIQMSMDVFKAIESYTEDNGMLQAILENNISEKLTQEDAMEFYSRLQKKKVENTFSKKFLKEYSHCERSDTIQITKNKSFFRIATSYHALLVALIMTAFALLVI